MKDAQAIVFVLMVVALVALVVGIALYTNGPKRKLRTIEYGKQNGKLSINDVFLTATLLGKSVSKEVVKTAFLAAVGVSRSVKPNVFVINEEELKILILEGKPETIFANARVIKKEAIDFVEINKQTGRYVSISIHFKHGDGISAMLRTIQKTDTLEPALKLLQTFKKAE